MGKRARKTYPTTKNAGSVVGDTIHTIESVAAQLTRPLCQKKPTTTVGRVARVIKHTVLLLLIIAVVVSAVSVVAHINEKVIRAAVLLAVSIALLVFANSHWHAVPLSVSFRSGRP